MAQNQGYNVMSGYDQMGNPIFQQNAQILMQQYQPMQGYGNQFAAGGLGHAQSYNPSSQLANMNSAGNFSGASTVIAETISSTIRSHTGASAYIPKKKIVMTEETFPKLNMAADSAGQKKTAVAQKKQENAAPKKSNDPCFGKPASFFVLAAMNPQIPSDDQNNPRIVSDDQQKFLFSHYPEYAPNMHALFDWLYATAIYAEQQAAYLKEQAEIDKTYRQKPKQGGCGK